MEILKGSLGFKGNKGDTGEIGTPVPYEGTFEELKNSNESKFYNYVILNSEDTNYEGHWIYYDRKASEWKDGGLYLSHYLTSEMKDWVARQKILEQKYDEQIKNIASSETQNAEIVDARGGFSTLGKIIKQKVFHFENVEAMKDCLTLIPGDVVQTLGYYEKDDGGEGLYEIVNDSSLEDDGGSVHELDNGLKAKLIIKDSVNAKQFGAKENEDITDIIELIINLNIRYIRININCSISEFTITKPITIDGENHTIKLIKSQGSTGDCLITNNSNSILKNLIFDGQSQYAYGIIKNANTYSCTVENCAFQNFKHTNKALQLNVIHIQEGSSTVIKECEFKNIKVVGNGTMTDNGGTGRCIRTYSDTETENETNLIIDKCLFKNNYNVDDEGEFIIEDFDNIHLQNTNSNNNITISNILSIDSGKRVIKCQASNVDINNITSINKNINASSFIACFSDNINISNCYSENLSLTSGIEIDTAKNVNISNVNIIDNNTTREQSYYSSGINIQKCDNLNVNNFKCKGFAENLRIWDVSNNLNFSNCVFSESIYDILNITTRTANSSSVENGITIKNVSFNNCYFHSKSQTETRIFDINETNSNTIENIKFVNCNCKIDMTNYLYGIIRDNSKYSNYSNCNFDITNTKDSIYTFIPEKGIKRFKNCNIMTTNNTPSFRISGTSRVYIDNMIAPNVSCNFQDTGKAILNYCNFRELVGNTETNCKNNSFDMS